MRSLSLLLALLSVLVLATSSSSSAVKITPPTLPLWFQSDFTEWYTDSKQSPPYTDGIPPNVNGNTTYSTNGKTYYDSTVGLQGAMIEERAPFCLPIFQDGKNRFPCTFINVPPSPTSDSIAYLLFNDTKSLPGDGCCLFSPSWHPPRPDFLQNFSVEATTGVKWSRVAPLGLTTWFKVPEIAPPAGPFYYSFAEMKSDPVELGRTAVYSSFSFRGFPPTTWVQQNFHKTRWERPDAAVWNLPAKCNNAPSCKFFGVDEEAMKVYAKRFSLQ